MDVGLPLLPRQTGNREARRKHHNARPHLTIPRAKDAWEEVKRRHLTPGDGQSGVGRVTFAELVGNYRKKGFAKLPVTTQSVTAHILDNYLIPRWGDSFALEINPDEIEEWLGALALANPTREKIRRVMNVVYRRGQKSRLLPMTGEGNPVKFVTQSSKSNYKAVIVSPEQAFRIMMELEDPYRTLVFLVAVTGLRISEALGLKWGDLDYDGKMIHLRRVWVGTDLVEHLKTEGSGAPVPLGGLLADALRTWYQKTPYGKMNEWVFPSFKLMKIIGLGQLTGRCLRITKPGRHTTIKENTHAQATGRQNLLMKASLQDNMTPTTQVPVPEMPPLEFSGR
jgi:integrase